MVSGTIQILIPLLLFLSIRGIDRRKVWILLPLTELMDFDYVVGVHRLTTHNVWVALPAALVAAWGLYRHNRSLFEWGAIAFGYLASHLLMDVFAGGVVMFWPLSDWNVCYYFAVYVRTATNTPEYYYGDCSAPGAPTVTELYPFLDYDETAMWVLVFAFTLAMSAWNGYKYWRERNGRPLAWDRA